MEVVNSRGRTDIRRKCAGTCLRKTCILSSRLDGAQDVDVFCQNAIIGSLDLALQLAWRQRFVLHPSDFEAIKPLMLSTVAQHPTQPHDGYPFLPFVLCDDCRRRVQYE